MGWSCSYTGIGKEMIQSTKGKWRDGRPPSGREDEGIETKHHALTSALDGAEWSALPFYWFLSGTNLIRSWVDPTARLDVMAKRGSPACAGTRNPVVQSIVSLFREELIWSVLRYCVGRTEENHQWKWIRAVTGASCDETYFISSIATGPVTEASFGFITCGITDPNSRNPNAF
jgi:hypothetical protein